MHSISENSLNSVFLRKTAHKFMKSQKKLILQSMNIQGVPFEKE